MDIADELDPQDEELEINESVEETEDVVKDEIQEPQPEPEDTKAEPESKKESPRVPVGELVAERKKRQEAERQAQETKEKLDLILNKLREQEEAKNAPPTPDFETDPFGYTLHNQEQISQRVEQTGQTVEELQQEIIAYKTYEQGKQTADYLINDFKKSHEDFENAREYLMQSNVRALVAQGYDEETARQTLRAREPQVNAQIAINGQNPAQVIYELARAYGYQGVTAKKESESEENDLNRLEKGQKYAKIGSSGGSSKSLSDIDANSGLDEIQSALNDIFG